MRLHLMQIDILNPLTLKFQTFKGQSDHSYLTIVVPHIHTHYKIS